MVRGEVGEQLFEDEVMDILVAAEGGWVVASSEQGVAVMREGKVLWKVVGESCMHVCVCG